MLSTHVFTLSTHPINVPALHTTTQLPRLIERTLSAPIYVSNSTGVFGHRAILMWGDRGMTGGFIIEQTHTLHSLLITEKFTYSNVCRSRICEKNFICDDLSAVNPLSLITRTCNSVTSNQWHSYESIYSAFFVINSIKL